MGAEVKKNYMEVLQSPDQDVPKTQIVNHYFLSLIQYYLLLPNPTTMNKSGMFLVCMSLVFLLAVPSQTQAQSQDGMKPLFDSQFKYAARILDLAEAMPTAIYS
jgi:hypothetical protein